MLIEISGMQKAGKSTIIDGLTFNHRFYKFPMGGVCKEFGVKPTWELQIAKDISTMELYKQMLDVIHDDHLPTITDRGPLSTIFYTLLFKRASDEDVEKFVKYLSAYPFWWPVWVEGINQPELTREKTDGFDSLQDGLDANLVKATKQKMFALLDKYGIPVIIHYNDFAQSIEKNQDEFASKILQIIAKARGDIE